MGRARLSRTVYRLAAGTGFRASERLSSSVQTLAATAYDNVVGPQQISAYCELNSRMIRSYCLSERHSHQERFDLDGPLPTMSEMYVPASMT